jgi:anti-sigma-K factor RskA
MLPESPRTPDKPRRESLKRRWRRYVLVLASFVAIGISAGLRRQTRLDASPVVVTLHGSAMYRVGIRRAEIISVLPKPIEAERLRDGRQDGAIPGRPFDAQGEQASRPTVRTAVSARGYKGTATPEAGERIGRASSGLVASWETTCLRVEDSASAATPFSFFDRPSERTGQSVYCRVYLTRL